MSGNFHCTAVGVVNGKYETVVVVFFCASLRHLDLFKLRDREFLKVF